LARSEPHTEAAQVTPAPDGPPSAPSRSLTDEAERIASSLEPELRQIIDMTMERVAEVERDVMHEARAAMQRSERDSRGALDRSSELVSNLEALTRTVSQMTEVLRTDLDGVVGSLRALHGLKVGLPADAATVEPPPSQPAAQEQSPEPAPMRAPEVEPSPELVEMFRGHITRMRDDGKSHQEAARVLRRFRFGHRFLDMLDEIYAEGGPDSGRRRRGGLFVRRRRRA
jgi:hypothetical protein